MDARRTLRRDGVRAVLLGDRSEQLVCESTRLQVATVADARVHCREER